MARKSTRPPSVEVEVVVFSEPASRFYESLLGVVSSASRAMEQGTGRKPTPRRLVNFLRGSQAPPEEFQPPNGLFALLEGFSARTLIELVERMAEDGILSAPEAVSKLEEGDLLRLFPPQPRLGSNKEVEERLRSLRREIARRERRAPYAVFPNATLVQLAALKPGSLAELARVPSMGEARLRKYGRRILTALACKK